MVNAIRAVLDVQRVQQLLSQNALVVRGTPDQIALAEKLVEDLDKVEAGSNRRIAIMQVTQDKLETLGISPPTSVTVTLQQSNATSGNTTSVTATAPITATATTSSTAPQLTSQHVGQSDCDQLLCRDRSATANLS